ncbi:MAG: hypothetical protein MHM6MM_006200 [Cercozoa sp. M6MM]
MCIDSNDCERCDRDRRRRHTQQHPGHGQQQATKHEVWPTTHASEWHRVRHGTHDGSQDTRHLCSSQQQLQTHSF